MDLPFTRCYYFYGSADSDLKQLYRLDVYQEKLLLDGSKKVDPGLDLRLRVLRLHVGGHHGYKPTFTRNLKTENIKTDNLLII